MNPIDVIAAGKAGYQLVQTIPTALQILKTAAPIIKGTLAATGIQGMSDYYNLNSKPWKRKRGIAKKVVFRGNRGYMGGSTAGLRSSGELKTHEVTLANGTATAVGGTIHGSLNLIDNGTTTITRVGKQAQITKINMNWVISLPSTSTIANSSDTVRLIVYMDKQANGAEATVADILEAAEIRSFNNKANVNRFAILKNKKYNLDAKSSISTATAGVDYLKSINIKFGKHPCKIEYKGTGGGIADVTSCNIGVLVLSLKGAITIGYKARVRFKD